MNRQPAQVRFDDALPQLIKYVRDNLKVDPSDGGVFVRDGFGRVAFFQKDKLSSRLLANHQRELKKVLGAAGFPAGAVQNPDSLGSSVLNNSTERWIDVDERLTTKSAVVRPTPPLRLPKARSGGSPSIGGEGVVSQSRPNSLRSTSWIRVGRNVLLIDLDLEAPGLASLVFEGDERPPFGVLDYLVENGLGGVSDGDLVNFVGTSRLTDREEGGGRVDLVPATGTLTLQYPENMLAKLSRALLEDTASDGSPRPLASQIRELVSRFGTRLTYDAVLVDARAGLSELTAGPLLGLGGAVALFGTDQPHTFEGYRYLMAHLATLPVPDPKNDWRERIHFVHGMSGASLKKRQAFDDRLYELLSETFYEEDEEDSGEGVFNFSLDAKNAPHKAWRIFFDQQFIDLNPIANRSLLEHDVYAATFGGFIDSAMEALGLGNEGT